MSLNKWQTSVHDFLALQILFLLFKISFCYIFLEFVTVISVNFLEFITFWYAI